MTLWRSTAAALVAAILAGSCAAAHAATAVQDQSSPGIGNDFDALVSQAHSAVATQTFTAGVSGTLSDVQIMIAEEFPGSSGSIRMTIYPAPGGVADATSPLATTSVAASSLPDLFVSTAFTDFAFTAPAVLVAGSQYAIRVDEVSSVHQHFFWAGDFGDTYPGGSDDDPAWGSSGDLSFTTFMIPTAAGASRFGYCSVKGNTWDDGTPIAVGTFLNLDAGQPMAGEQFKGATPAIFLEGIGLACGVPSGFVSANTTVGYFGLGSDGPFPYYKHTS